MEPETEGEKRGGWKGWFWIVLCCLPVIVIIVLVALGYWSWG